MEYINTICWKFNFWHHHELVEPSWVGLGHWLTVLLVIVGSGWVILKIWRVGSQKLDLQTSLSYPITAWKSRKQWCEVAITTTTVTVPEVSCPIQAEARISLPVQCTVIVTKVGLTVHTLPLGSVSGPFCCIQVFCSYWDILDIVSCMMRSLGSDAEVAHGNVYPPPVTQWVSNNVDQNVKSLDDTGTFRGMGMMSLLH